MIKKNLKKILSILIFFIIALWLVFYVKRHINEFREIHLVSYFNFFVLIILSFIYLLVQGLVLKVTLNSFQIHLKFYEWFGITLITIIGNFLSGFGGLGFRSFYLKKKYSFNYSHFVSTTAFASLVIILISALFGVNALLLLFFEGKAVIWEIVMIYLIVLVVCLFFWFVPLKPLKTENNFLKHFSNVITSWHRVKRDRILVKQIFLLTFFEFLIFASIFYFGFRTFGFQISYFSSFLPASLSLYVLYISFVPAALGFYEAAVVYSSKIIGLTVVQGLSVGFLTRAVIMFWTFALGLIFIYILIKSKQDKRNIT